MAGNSQFVSQHDIRRLSDGRITVFDNGAPPYPGRPARGIALSVKGKTVKLSRSLQRSSSLRSPSQGNVQGLPNGNFMVGWGGSTPFFTEFTASGNMFGGKTPARTWFGALVPLMANQPVIPLPPSDPAYEH